MHDALTLAKASAYSSIVSLFPALLVVASVLALTPATASFRGTLHTAFDQVLPPNAVPLLQNYFSTPRLRMHSAQLLLSALLVSFFGAVGVMTSLMEGFRRAYNVPRNYWSFWHKRVVSFSLVPFSLVPMTFASLLVVFGHVIEAWMVVHSGYALKGIVLFGWMLVRWAIAMLCSVAVIALIYHYGTPRTCSWRYALPGAAMATLMWFVSTLIFGWYVTRHANYARFYGSLAAGIALLFWLYIISLSILIGAEFNAQLFPKREISSAVTE
ncbi:MAG: YihY/virulence factor BrkB family protein [Acidobacteriaceae bacterium]